MFLALLGLRTKAEIEQLAEALEMHTLRAEIASHRYDARLTAGKGVQRSRSGLRTRKAQRSDAAHSVQIKPDARALSYLRRRV